MAAGGDERLAGLRRAMADSDGKRGVHAYIIPSEDPHMSEYSPDCFKRREFISRFTGTAGTAVVTADKALLWTDGRYFLQGEKELGPEWTLMRAGTNGVPEIEDWLARYLPPGGRVGVDPFCHTVDSVRRLQRRLHEAGKEVVPLLADGNLVDLAWGSSRPEAPKAPLRVHPLLWAGETASSKIECMRRQMRASGASTMLVTALDEVAWLFNLRGKDVSCNPVFLSYALVTANPPPGVAGGGPQNGGGAPAPAAGPIGGTAVLYVDQSKLTQEVEAHLKEAGVVVKGYGAVLDDVRDAAAGGAALWLDSSKVSYAVYQAAKEAASDPKRGTKRVREEDNGGAAGAFPPPNPPPPSPIFRIVESASPISMAKAIKNQAELEGMREAHLRDAVALCDFLSWLEDEVLVRGKAVTEVEVDEQLTARRAQQEGFVEPSFSTIAGVDGNGAIIHYRAKPGTCSSVTKDSMLLLDSGGQYDCGTTDITRTMHFATPTPQQRTAYTRTLQGHIALDSAVFPENTPGCALDVLARRALWAEGLNYRHGTGHGVGAALNVHEGPMSISMRWHITVPLAPGMVVSNEPGYYEDGSFGVRIENLCVVKEANTPNRFGGQPYMTFERLTMVPIQAKLMDLSIMTDDDIAWVDKYHEQVRELVAPRLADKPRALEWLHANTRPLRSA